MLFDSGDINKDVQDHEPKTPKTAKSKLKNKFVLGTAGETLQRLLPEIEKDSALHLPSFGNWSFNHMIAHCLSLTGAAKVYLTSWTISEQPVKELLQLLDKGTIAELVCLFDSRVPKQCPNAYQIAQHRFANLKLCHIHAKMAVLINDQYQVTINSSANLSRNDAIESYVVTESLAIAKHHAAWITEQMNDAYPFKK